MILPKPIYESLPYLYIAFPTLILIFNFKNIIIWTCSAIIIGLGLIIIKLRKKYRDEFK